MREFEAERAALVLKAEDDTRNSRFVNILFKTFHARFPVSGAARERKTSGAQGKENSGNSRFRFLSSFLRSSSLPFRSILPPVNH